MVVSVLHRQGERARRDALPVVHPMGGMQAREVTVGVMLAAVMVGSVVVVVDVATAAAHLHKKDLERTALNYCWGRKRRRPPCVYATTTSECTLAATSPTLTPTAHTSIITTTRVINHSNQPTTNSPRTMRRTMLRTALCWW